MAHLAMDSSHDERSVTMVLLIFTHTISEICLVFGAEYNRNNDLKC